MARGPVMLALPLPERVALGRLLRESGFRVSEQPIDRITAAWQPVTGPASSSMAASEVKTAWAVVVDAEAPGARRLLRVLHRANAATEEPNDPSGVPTRRSSPWLGPLVVAVGTSGGEALDLHSSDTAFERPLDLDGIVHFLLKATGGAESLPWPEEDPADVREPRSLPVPGYDSSLADDFPAIAGLPDVEAMLPGANLGGDLSRASGARLSEDIEELLESSASRAANARLASAASEPDESPVLVSQDVLTTLDELLLGDDEPSGMGGASSHFGTPVRRSEPSAAGSHTGALATAARSAPAWHTPPAPDAATGSEPPRLDAAREAEDPAPDRSQPSVPPEDSEARSSTGSMVRTEQHRASSLPPESPARAESSRPPMGLHESLPIPSPTIGTVEAPVTAPGPPPRPPGELGAMPPSQPPFPSTVPLNAPWPAASSWTGGAASASAPTSAQPSEPPRTYHDPFGHEGGAPTAPPPYGMASLPPSAWERPSSMPPPRTWAEVAGAAPAETSHGAQPTQPTDPLVALAEAIAARATGALSLAAAGERVRWVLLQDGDIVTATSQVAEEGLLAFLIERGSLSSEIAELYANRLPHSGRHAAAALIANGFLGQDELWPVLRAHAEWLLTRAVHDRPARCRAHPEAPERLRAEPNVFGGAAGVEVFIETARRVLPAPEAIARLGGKSARLNAGPRAALLAESALTATQTEAVRGAVGSTAGDVLARQGDSFAPTLYALVALQVLTTPTASAPSPASPAVPEAFDPLDAQAVRERVRARMALVREADYFTLLGLTPEATDYEIRRAFVQLRGAFEPAKLLTAATADLADDVRLIVEVLEEAYQILRDPHRRTRYRKAILETGH